jgi:competence protein ComEA
MPSPVRRRQRDTDPVVAARLQAISYADPYVFVHASDVLDSEVFYDEPAVEPVAGWVPRPPEPPPPPPVPPTTQVRARPSWTDLVRQRLEPARSGVAALVVLGLVAAVVAGFAFLRAQPSSQEALPLHPSTSGGSAVLSHSASPAATLLVDVAGKVHHPGVVRLKNGARVLDAVRAAGGALPGTSLDSLNLAAKVTDGQQVAVGGAPVAPAADGGTGDPTGPVDLNTATTEQLQTLSGVGPVLAQRIIDYRTTHGPFTSVDALQQVGGIGPAKFAEIKDHVTA